MNMDILCGNIVLLTSFMFAGVIARSLQTLFHMRTPAFPPKPKLPEFKRRSHIIKLPVKHDKSLYFLEPPMRAEIDRSNFYWPLLKKPVSQKQLLKSAANTLMPTLSSIEEASKDRNCCEYYTRTDLHNDTSFLPSLPKKQWMTNPAMQYNMFPNTILSKDDHHTYPIVQPYSPQMSIYPYYLMPHTLPGQNFPEPPPIHNLPKAPWLLEEGYHIPDALLPSPSNPDIIIPFYASENDWPSKLEKLTRKKVNLVNEGHKLSTMKPIEFKNEDKTRPNILQKQLIIEEHVSSSVKPLTQLKQEDLSNPNMDRPVQQNILPLNLDYYINNNDNKKPDLYNKKQYNIEFGAPLNSINSKELSENEKQWWALLQNPSFLMHKPPKPIFYQGLTDEILKLTDPYVKPHRYTLPPLNLPDSLPEKNQYYSPLWNSFHPIMIGYPINAIPNTVSKTIPNIVHNIEPNILHNISNPYLSPFIHSFHPLSYGYSSNPIPNTVPNIVHNTNPNMVPNTALNPIALPLIRPNLPPVIYNVPKLYNTQGQTMPVPPNGKNCFLGQNILNPPDAKSHPIITTHLDDLNAAVHPLLDAALAENIKMKRKTELSVVTKLSALKAQEHVAEMNRRTLYEKAREADADYIRKLNRELNLITEWKLANLSAEEAFHKLITHKRKLSEQEREVHRVKEAEDELYGQLLESQAQLALADMALIPRMPSEAALRQFLSGMNYDRPIVDMSSLHLD